LRALDALMTLLDRGSVSLEELASKAKCSVEEVAEALRSLEASKLVWVSGGSVWLLDRVVGAIEALRLGAPLMEVASRLTWRDFEAFCSKAFEAHGYTTTASLRFKWTGRSYEVDVAAWRRPILAVVDCKEWGLRAGKASQLRRAVDRHLERSEALANALPSLKERLRVPSGVEAHVVPCLVTLLEEALLVHRGVPVVPVSKLNSFIQELHAYLDSLTVFKVVA